MAVTLLGTFPASGFWAQQGITITASYAYATANRFTGVGSDIGANLYQLDRKTFAPLAHLSLPPTQEIWPGVTSHSYHAGQTAINPADGFLYATFMAPAQAKSALLKFDPVTLELLAVIDTTAFRTYLDAIAFSADGRIWLNYDACFASYSWAGLVVDGAINPDTEARDWKFYLYDSTRWGVPQGLQATAQNIFVVPENDPQVSPPDTLPEDNGIMVFARADLQQYVGAGAPVNAPAMLYGFQIPSPGHADLEAFAFDPFNANCIWIPSAGDEGATLWHFRLEPFWPVGRPVAEIVTIAATGVPQRLSDDRVLVRGLRIERFNGAGAARIGDAQAQVRSSLCMDGRAPAIDLGSFYVKGNAGDRVGVFYEAA